MKKLFVFAMVVLFTSTTFAQDSGDLSPSPAQNNGDLENQFYFRFGYSNPSWKYYGFDGKEDFSDEVRRFGGVFELGSIFYINRLKIGDGLRLGINADYLSISAHAFDVTDNLNLYNVFIGSKVGLVFSYNPTGKLVLDAVAKVNPIWGAGTGLDDGDMDQETDIFVGYMGIKYSIGLNVRWSILIFGFEYNPGSMKLANDTGSGDYLGNANDDSDKTPMPAMNFTFGFSF